MVTQSTHASTLKSIRAGVPPRPPTEIIEIRRELEDLGRHARSSSPVAGSTAVPATPCLEPMLAGFLGRLRELLDSQPVHQNDLEPLALLASNLATLVKSARLHDRERQRSYDLEKLVQVVSDQRDRHERTTATYEKLIRTMLYGNGIEGVTRALASILENPVAVEDRFFQSISHAPNPTLGKPLESTTLEFGGTAPALLSDPRFREQLRLVNAEGYPVTIPPFPEYGACWSRLMAAITVGKTRFGYLSVFGKNRPVTALDRAAIEHATAVFALELQKGKTASEAEEKLKMVFLDDLLMGRYEGGDALQRREAFVDYGLARPHAVVVVEVDCARVVPDENDFSSPGPAAAKKRVLEAIDDIVDGIAPGSWVMSKGDGVIVLLDLSGEASGKTRSLTTKALAEAVRNEIKRRFQDFAVSVAVGAKCERPEDYKRSYQVARKSLDILKAFDRHDRTVCFERLGVYQLLLQIQDVVELKDFVDRLVGPLVSYDRDHNACLIETLESYLQNDCNLQKTARINFLHANTVKYRLQRIEELARVDLDEAETRLDLHLALKLWHLIN
ncbi:MAG: helix-turn-helix domain-containing protein [Chloroflexi bacterium]|nr:helix-turn-helix domain-containing protein [Chloroflexota bacterium]